MGTTLPNNQPGLTGQNIWRQFMVDHQETDILAPATGSRWMHNNLLKEAVSILVTPFQLPLPATAINL
jgi:hypothetical protein